MTEAHKELDTRGMACPLPILKAKKALAEMSTGDVLKVLAPTRLGPGFPGVRAADGQRARRADERQRRVRALPEAALSLRSRHDRGLRSSARRFRSAFRASPDRLRRHRASSPVHTGSPATRRHRLRRGRPLARPSRRPSATSVRPSARQLAMRANDGQCRLVAAEVGDEARSIFITSIGIRATSTSTSSRGRSRRARSSLRRCGEGLPAGAHEAHTVSATSRFSVTSSSSAAGGSAYRRRADLTSAASAPDASWRGDTFPRCAERRCGPAAIAALGGTPRRA